MSPVPKPRAGEYADAILPLMSDAPQFRCINARAAVRHRHPERERRRRQRQREKVQIGIVNASFAIVSSIELRRGHAASS